MSYQKPQDVLSPNGRVSVIRVLRDGGPSTAAVGNDSLALGVWDGDPALLHRWNGTTDKPLGTPQARGYATWHVLPGWLYGAVVATLPEAEREFAAKFLGADS